MTGIAPLTTAEVGHAVRELRKAADMSQEELARAGGLSRSNVSRLERGLLKLSMADGYRVATALGMQFSELLAHAERVR